MKDIRDKTVDMVMCDLPYGTTQLKFDKDMLPIELLWKQYERIVKDNGAILLFSKQPFTTDLIHSNRKWYRYNLIWLKNIANGFLNSKVMPLQVYEEICVFYNKKPTYNPQMEHGFERKVSKVNSKRKCQQTEIYNKAVNIKDYDSTSRYPINILYFDVVRNNKDRLHPTQKPVELLEYLINTYTNEYDTVLDNCMGSGSTGVACINTDRNFIGIEINEEYFNVAKNRIDSISKKEKLTNVSSQMTIDQFCTR